MANYMKKPQWINEMLENWKGGVSNFFILNGNVNDYAITDVLFYNFLEIELRKAGFAQVTEFVMSNGAGMSQKNTEMSIENIAARLRNPDKELPTAVIIRNPELYFPNVPEGNANYGTLSNFSIIYDALVSMDFINSKNVLIFISEAIHSFNPRFLSTNTRGLLIDIEFPNEEIRYRYIKEKYDRYDYLRDSEISPKEFARITAGLTLMSIEDVILKGRIKGRLERSLIVGRKTELIKKEYGNVLEVMDTDGFSFADFAGQDHLKEYHREVIVNPMITGNTEVVPKGLLYTGPPGTGKTHFARCLAGEAGMNFVELKPSKLKDMWVGNSQKNFAKALNCIRSITPVGVFIDEIDQVFSRSGNNGSGVEGDFFSMFLTILSEPQNRGKIVWIAATNYPNNLDEALKRTGRLDKKMPFLPPEIEDRKKVLEIYLNKANIGHNISNEQMYDVASATEGYTQAEIEGIVVKTVELASRRKSPHISILEVNDAMRFTSKSSSAKLEEMVDLAIKECNDLEFLPEKYRQRRENLL